jgi:hypothetical protein
VYLRRVAERSGRGDEGGAQAPGSDRFSIGRYLASQRELRGISLDDLAARTKIPRRNLERLESGAFDAQQDGFVRGFVRTVADALGLDAREAVMRMSDEPTGVNEDELWRRRARIALLTLVSGAVLLLVFGLTLRLATRWVVEPAGGPPDHLFRRDAVRSLADRKREPGAAPARRPDARTEPADPMGD